MKKKNIGSSFDDWLREEGIYEETTAVGQKAVQQSPKSDPPNRDSTSRRKTRIA
jgi:hypothetical protein